MRDKLAKLKGAAAGEIASADVWAEVELIPGPGLKLDASSGTFKATMRADEIPEQLSQAEAASMLSSAADARKKLKELALEMKSKSGTRVPKKEAP